MALICSSVDYIRPTHPCLDDLSIIDSIISVFDTKLDHGSSHGTKIGRVFSHCVSTPCNGARLAYNINPSGTFDVLLTLSGELLSSQPATVIRELIGVMKDMGFGCTRIDLAIDDYSKSISFEEVSSAVDNKNLKFFQVGHVYKGLGNKKGFTVGLGSRSGDRYGRFYDKEVESAGRIKSYRLESELKGNIARDTFDRLAECACFDDELWLNTVASFCLGTFEFIDRAADTCVSRCPRLPWWQSFIDKVVAFPVRFIQRRPVCTVRNSMNWVQRSVAVTLATLREALGDIKFSDWVSRTVNKAECRMKSRHQVMIEVYQSIQLPDIPPRSQRPAPFDPFAALARGFPHSIPYTAPQ
jgi:hypothetical protein